MGQFKIEIVAVGGHGCNREKKNGEMVYGCQSMNCPDCLTRDFVDRMRAKFSLESATFTHWPGQPCEVSDNLIDKRRTGNF